MKYITLSLFLLAGIAGRGQQKEERYRIEERPWHINDVYFDSAGLVCVGKGLTHESDYSTFLWRGIDSMYRRILVLEKKVDSLEKRPYLQLIPPGIQLDPGFWIPDSIFRRGGPLPGTLYAAPAGYKLMRWDHGDLIHDTISYR